MEKKFTFRIAEKTDSEAINVLVNSVYRGDNARKGWTSEADILGGIRITADKIKDLIEANNSIFLLILENDKIIGCVQLEKKDSNCHLGMLSIDVNFQNKGIGKLLMDRSEEYARIDLGCNQMEMKVIGQRTELINYYLRRGYKLTGEKEPFILNTHFGEPKIDGIYFEYMVKQLD